jgi:hypothetical protein
VAAVGDIERAADESAIGRRTADRDETGIGSVGLHDVYSRLLLARIEMGIPESVAL